MLFRYWNGLPDVWHLNHIARASVIAHIMFVYIRLNFCMDALRLPFSLIRWYNVQLFVNMPVWRCAHILFFFSIYRTKQIFVRVFFVWHKYDIIVSTGNINNNNEEKVMVNAASHVTKQAIKAPKKTMLFDACTAQTNTATTKSRTDAAYSLESFGRCCCCFFSSHIFVSLFFRFTFHCARARYGFNQHEKNSHSRLQSIYLWQEDGNVWNFIWLPTKCLRRNGNSLQHKTISDSICALLDLMLFMFGSGWYFMRLLLPLLLLL